MTHRKTGGTPIDTPLRARWLLATALGVCLVLLLVVSAGCGGAAADPATNPDTASGDTGDAASSLSDNFWIAANAKQGDGSTARLTLRLGELSAAGDYVAPRGFAGLADACNVDYRRDALVPGQLVVRNTTDGFPIEIETGFTIARPFFIGEPAYDGKSEYEHQGPRVSVAERLSDRDTCDFSEADPIDALTAFILDEGGQGAQRFVVVVHDYYSPEHPQGDSKSLADLRVKISEPTGYKRSWTLTCADASLPLDGSSARLDGAPISEPAYEFDDDYTYRHC